MNYIIPILFFAHVSLGYSQNRDSTSAVTPDYIAEVRASVELSTRKVPQNRTVALTIKVTWQGDLERFEIENFETPLLTNLEIVANSSSNWVGEKRGEKLAIKAYEFTLKPKTLGMAYVDAAIIKYRDAASGKMHHLATTRLEVEVTPGIIERDFGLYVRAGLVLLLLLFLAAISFFVLKRKRARDAALLESTKQLGPIEDRYLANLKNEVNPDAVDKVSAFSALSSLWRRYLSEKFEMHATGMATQEISQEMLASGFEQKTVEITAEILDACDVAKFSGGQAEPGKLDRAFALAEELLQKNRKEYLTENGIDP